MEQSHTQTTGNRFATVHLLPAVHQFAYEKESQLLYQVKTNHFPAVNDTLNQLLGYTLVSGKNSLLNSSQRMSEFYSVLMRTLIELGMDDWIFTRFEELYQAALNPSLTYQELCEHTQQLAGFFVQSIRSCSPLLPGQRAVCQACGYMARHYASRITLHETAAYVHLNASYFSSLFRRVTGRSFKEHLNHIRVEESKKLLINSSYDLIDIAVATGFEDQSYFSKTFRRYVGTTPGHFRKEHCIMI